MNSTSGRRTQTQLRALAALVSTLLGVGLLAGCGAGLEVPAEVVTGSTTPAQAATQPSLVETTATDETADDATEADDADELSYAGQDGRTALELLLEADPGAEVTGEGDQAFVTAIGGRAADPNGEFWALYVNGEPSTVGAGSLVTQEGDEITWKLETF